MGHHDKTDDFIIFYLHVLVGSVLVSNSGIVWPADDRRLLGSVGGTSLSNVFRGFISKYYI